MTVKELRNLLEVITAEQALFEMNIDDIEVVIYDQGKTRAVKRVYVPVNLVYNNKVLAIT